MIEGNFRIFACSRVAAFRPQLYRARR
jgi:hypothetical protein